MTAIEEADLKKILPSNGPSIQEVKKYLDKYKNEYIILKCGGRILSETELFNIFVKDVCLLKKLNFNPCVIHGGGTRITNKLNELNIKSNFIKGLRVTDSKIINIVEGVLIEFNKEIAKAFTNNSCKARSITSKENNIIIDVKADNKDLGFVGTPTKIKSKTLNQIAEANEIPIIAPLGLNSQNQVFNINADTVAGSIAKELKARRLLIVSDVEGVLDKDNNLISEINSSKADKMINNEIITGGMIPKVNNCIDVASNGVRGVAIIDGRKPHSILFELLSDSGAGTLLRQ
jgi:acetylglutamate kinase